METDYDDTDYDDTDYDDTDSWPVDADPCPEPDSYNSATGSPPAILAQLDGLPLPSTLTESQIALLRRFENAKQRPVKAARIERQTTELLKQVANILWKKTTNTEACPDNRVPSVADTHDYLQTKGPIPASFDTLEGALVAIQSFGGGIGVQAPDYMQRIDWVALGEPVDMETSKCFTVCLNGQWHRALCFVNMDHLVDVWNEGLSPRTQDYVRFNGQFPLEPLVADWLGWKIRQHALPVSRTRTSVLPQSLEDASIVSSAGTLPPAPSSCSSIVPTLPIDVIDTARVTPIPQRLFYELLLAVFTEDRSLQSLALSDVTLRRLKDWIWPHGWQRNRDLPTLIQSLRELDNMRIRYGTFDCRVVAVDRLPTSDTALDEIIPFRLCFVAKSNGGPKIDVERLRYWGLKSAAAWRAYIRLAYIWDRAQVRVPGRSKGQWRSMRAYGNRPEVLRDAQGVILNAEGKPVFRGKRAVKNWNDDKAIRTGNVERSPLADNVPLLDAHALVHLFFDGKKVPQARFRDRLRDSQAALDKLQKESDVIVERDSAGWRILEPSPIAKKSTG